MRKVLSIVGARPQFIKAAPVGNALREVGLPEVMVHTGQHFDASMSEVFFEELNIKKPSYNLNVNSLSHGAMTGRMLEKIEETIVAENPGLVLVYGDTNSTVAGALAAAKLNVPVAHVEAGLRSFNRQMPEEINRVVVDHLSDILFCPTQTAAENLGKEGITTGLHTVGDVMFDATIAAIEVAKCRSKILDQLALEPKKYSAATVHRAENTDDPAQFEAVFSWLEDAATQQQVIMPAHPRTRKLIEQLKLKPNGIRVIDPLGYIDMTWLTHNASIIFTDSGGLQKEAYFHRVPCITLRDETEWVETINAGWNKLWQSETLVSERSDIVEYGDGTSSKAIANILATRLN